VKYDPASKPEVSNLMSIYSHCADLTIADIEARYEGQGYGPFKKDLAEAVVGALEPLQQRYNDIRSSGELRQILRQGAEQAAEIANRTVREVKEKMGFVLP
jgi:tryptophanyl-tRNA synthetase